MLYFCAVILRLQKQNLLMVHATQTIFASPDYNIRFKSMV